MSTGDLLLLDRAAPPIVVTPTRDQVCGVRHQFQGMSITLPPGSTFDPLKARYWFDPLINDMGDQADRLAVYAAHRAVGDTHLNLSLGLNGLTGLPRLLMIATEAIAQGGLTGILLMCMGDGHGTPNSDPGALGYTWLMANFSRIYDAVRTVRIGDHSLADHVVFVPGYDGVVPDWQPPSTVDRFLLLARSWITLGAAGYLGLELSAGYCVWGDEHAIDGNNWTTPAGHAVDVILQEGPIDMGPPQLVPPPPGPVPDRWTQVYQIVGRMVQPYSLVPGQWDDLHAPFLLGGGTPRGPFFYDYWEFDTMRWTGPWRQGTPPYPLALVQQHRQAGYDMGCAWVG